MPTLEKMAMSLLRKDASLSDSILYTVCVNVMAYEFLTTALMVEEKIGLSQRLQQNALRYRATAQAALRKIPLVTTPSLALLQAIICGVSYAEAINSSIVSNQYPDLPVSGIGGHHFFLGVNKDCLQDLHRYWSQYYRCQWTGC
jgi:hypothetical protein